MDRIQREDLQENIAIIKINRPYKKYNSKNKNISALELYDITRGFWKRKLDSVKCADYVLAVVYGEIGRAHV